MLPSVSRRAFLKALAATAGTAGIPLSALAQGEQGNGGASWQNWSGNQSARPEQIAYPADRDALARLLADTRGTVRAFGGSHSFSAVVPTDDTLISLEAFNGLRQRHDDGSLTVGAGSRVAQVAELAWGEQRGLVNEPDINLQSLAGALATATHGTGLGLPCLSGQVAGLTLMDMEGGVHRLNEDDGDLFRAACCSLGALGLITEVRMKTEPAYRLEEHIWTLPLDQAIAFVDKEKDRYRNLEFFAFPRGDTAIVKTMSLTDKPDHQLEQEDSNELLELASELCMRAGWLTPTMQKLVTFFVEETRRRGPAHKIYPNRRAVRFNEMEYTVPAERGLECLEEVCQVIRDREINVFFPIEFRYTAADDTLLSMFSGQAGASLSIHQYYKQDQTELFQATEPVLRKYRGRPHWGKLHNLGPEQLRELYPRFDDFLALRREIDPSGRLLNDHLRRLFGEEPRP